MAELLTGGTENHSAIEIAQAIETMAGSLGGFSGRSSIGLQMDVLSHEFESALDLFAECLGHSTFPEEEVDRIRGQILAEIAAQEDNLAGSAFRQFNRTLFAGHPFRLDVLGTQDSIETMTVEALRDHYSQYVRPSFMTLAVVGDVDPAAVLENVERVFDVTAHSEPPVVHVPEIPLRAREQVVGHRERQQAHLVLGFRGVTMSDDDRWPLEVLAAILSGQGGRLFFELRDRQSLAYSVSAFNLIGLDGGYFATYIATSPSKLEEAVSGMEREIARLQEELVTEEELERAQRYLVGHREISLQRGANRAAYLAFDEAYGLGYDDHYQHADRIFAVTPEDVLRVSREYLNLENGVLSIIQPRTAPAESID